MGGEQGKIQRQAQIYQEREGEKGRYESQMAILRQHDARTKVPHLLIELRTLGFIEICGKDIGGIYGRLDEFLRRTFQCTPVASVLRPEASVDCGCCINANLRLLNMEEFDKVCDMNYVCGTHGMDGSVFGASNVFRSRGQQGENNMGKLTMLIANFMTHECGWGLQLCDGGNLGKYGQYREQQIKFKAPHPLNMIAPHIMIELRQCGYIEINGPNSNGIHEKIHSWLIGTWASSKADADPNYCDLKYSTTAFKKRGNEGENNMGMRSCEIVDFMTQQCAWTLLACNGGNYGRKGDMREQQLVFRNDEHVQHGLNHIMIELRDRGYIEVNGLHDCPEIGQVLDENFKRWRCTDYKAGMFESSEMFCDKKYTTPPGFYIRHGTTNNLGKLTIQLATLMSQQGWLLTLCNGGNISDYQGYSIKREQQIKFSKARPNEKADHPLLMIELRTVPQDHGGRYQGYVEVNGPDTNGIYQKLSDYMAQTMLGKASGPQAFCDYLFTIGCFRLRDHRTDLQSTRWDGKLIGESNFGRYVMRLCDFMVDHIGEWDLIVCNGNSIDSVFRVGKDDTRSVTGREQQLVFRYRPGGRAVFMADAPQTVALGRPPLQAPQYWNQSTKSGTVGHYIVPATDQEKEWLQRILDGTFKKKTTRDRDVALAERFVVVSALRSEHPELWERFAKHRGEVHQKIKARGKDDFQEPKTRTACPELAARCTHPKFGNPTNEAYFMHGSNPTSAQSILGTSFKVELAGASAGTMFGPGIYLAEASSKADEYARDETGGAFDGLFAVLFCRAVVGRSFVTEKPGDFHEKCTAGPFDSVMGDREKAVGTYREFIFFHEGAVYPEYVAFYRREYADGVTPPPSAAPAAKMGAPPQIAMAAPAAVAPVQMQVTVPEGSGPGSMLQLTTPDGRTVQVKVPEGTNAGETMLVQV